MLTTIDLRGQVLDPRTLRARLPRAELDVQSALDVVGPLCDDVAARGSVAVYEYGERFDGVRPPSLRVPAQRLVACLDGLDPAVRSALEVSIERARRVHAAQRPADRTVDVVPGGTVTQRWLPVRRVGLYVPGGLAVYPSSVVMNVVPAQEAGVESLAVTSPPQPDGWPHPVVLAACALLGVDEVYAAGGAQAVALLAHGSSTQGADDAVEPVDVVTGPGNVYVASAKRYVQGVVGIDAEAGPTEIMVVADGTADAEHVAADLVSQAEHDPNAGAVLVTWSMPLAEQVGAAVERRAGATRHSERVRQALSGPQSAIVLVDDAQAALVVADAYAAEHLEVQTADAAALAAQVRAAGAVFVGAYSPVSLGDYAAGSNHVLPTAGTARFASGLSVHSFLRCVHVVDYSRDALARTAPHVVALSAAEDLPAHGEAVRARFEGQP